MKIRMIPIVAAPALCAAILLLAAGTALSGPAGDSVWTFAVSGDSRNCGDVVIPGIALDAMRHKPRFYWHLGDFRAISSFDEDILHLQSGAGPPDISDYLKISWPDFIENQIKPWGAVPVFLGIGNHDLVPPKNRDEFIAQFANWLNSPAIQEQRQKDDPGDFRVKTYYHWVERGVDFIYMDNASADQFDSMQMRWIEGVLDRVGRDPAIKTVVVGMHRALPDSISADHGMNESPAGEVTGRAVYASLLRLQNDSRKRVYVLASHSHYFMDGIFNTAYWKAHGGILPGWIAGTAGAPRYALPFNWKDARAAEADAYGYLLASVRPDGEIRFTFERLDEGGVPGGVKKRYSPGFVHWCFTDNRR